MARHCGFRRPERIESWGSGPAVARPGRTPEAVA
jgi:hypothetical protein